MITPINIQEALNLFLKEKVADNIKLKCHKRGSGEYVMKSPKIFTGMLMPEESGRTKEGTEEDFPYIGTRITKVQHTGQEAVATIKIYFGAYCPDDKGAGGEPIGDGSGYRDIWNMMEAVRIALCSAGTIDRIARLKPETLMAEIPEIMTYPYYEGWMVTEWVTGLPGRTLGKFTG